MLKNIIECILFLASSMISAYLGYLLDKKYDYVSKLNRKLKIGKSINTLFYIGIMSLLMFIVPYVIVVKLLASKYIAYIIVSFIVGICCYSAMEYRRFES